MCIWKLNIYYSLCFWYIITLVGSFKTFFLEFFWKKFYVWNYQNEWFDTWEKAAHTKPHGPHPFSASISFCLYEFFSQSYRPYDIQHFTVGSHSQFKNFRGKQRLGHSQVCIACKKCKVLVFIPNILLNFIYNLAVIVPKNYPTLFSLGILRTPCYILG